MTVHTRVAKPLVDGLAQGADRPTPCPARPRASAPRSEREAAEFVAEVARAGASRASSRSGIESTGGEAGRRRMRHRRSSTTTCRSWSTRSPTRSPAAQLAIHRLLHPVVCVDRDDKGKLHDVEPLCDDEDAARIDDVHRARPRRCARPPGAGRGAAARCSPTSAPRCATGAQLQAPDARRRRARSRIRKARRCSNWFADGAMTLLGYQVERPRRSRRPAALGIFSIPGRADRRGRLPRRDALFRAAAARSR